MFHGKKKAVTFSYDDGVVQDRRLVALFNKYGLKGTFNLNSQRFGDGGQLPVDGGVLVDHSRILEEEVATLYAGHEVAAHTLTHPNLTTCDDEEVIRQVEQDRLNLSKLVGYEVVGMAYAGGGVNHDDRVVELIQNHTGIRYARGITRSYNFDEQTDLYRLQPTYEFEKNPGDFLALADRFLNAPAEKPQILYIFGHSYRLDANPAWWDMYEEFCAKIAHRDDVFYGTNREVFLRE